MLWTKCAVVAALLAVAAPARGQPQDPADRADPAVIEQEQEDDQHRPDSGRESRIVPPDPARVSAQPVEMVVGAVQIQGATAIPVADFAPVIEPFLGRTLDREGLAALAGAIAGRARSRGYGLATAWVPAQDINRGILIVQLDEGRIDAIRAEGPAAAFVERRLAHLTQGRPVRTAELERELLLLGDMPGFWVGDARLVRNNGRSTLNLRSRYDRISGRLSFDNWGTSTIGPLRARASIDRNGLLRPGDRLTIGGTITPADPHELQLLDAGYRLPVGRSGTEVGAQAYVGWTNSMSFDGRELEGDSTEFGVDVAHPIQRSRDFSLWLSGRFGLRDSELVRPDRVLRDDRIVTAAASINTAGRLFGGRFRTRTTMTRGLDLFDATRRGDPDASRSDASGVFTRLDYWADYHRSLGGRFSLALASEGQLSDRPLLSSEEMGLGGRRFLRAFDYREVSGDDGAAGSAELRFDLSDLPPIVRNLQLYAYADAGWVENDRGGRGGGSLASAGGGVRVTLRNRMEAGFEIGVPLTDGGFEREPNPRFSFSIISRF